MNNPVDQPKVSELDAKALEAAVDVFLGTPPDEQPADLLGEYAGFIHNHVKGDDIELHPYLPHIERVIEALRAAPPAPTSERVQVLEDAAEHYFYALNAAHGDLVRQMLQQNRPIKDIEGVGNFRALNELARRNGFRMLVTIEPVPDAAALKATP